MITVCYSPCHSLPNSAPFEILAAVLGRIEAHLVRPLSEIIGHRADMNSNRNRDESNAEYRGRTQSAEMDGWRGLHNGGRNVQSKGI